MDAEKTSVGHDAKRKDVIDTLLIGGGFFGYANEISKALERRTRRVKWFEDRPGLDTITKATLRVAPGLLRAKSERYFDSIIEDVRGQPIRDVLVIKGEALTPWTVERLRRALPHARFTLYFWDSYRNMPKDSSEKVALFDSCFSFDPEDAQRDKRLRYRPLFFVDDYSSLPLVEPDIDLLFVGTVHSDRYAILSKLAKSLPRELRFEKILYFPSSAIYATRRIFDPQLWRAHREEFIFKPIGKATIQTLVARSRVVVDIERIVQRGFTMRTIEMLGAGKKILTTNSSILAADFYRPSNIAVIDRNVPAVSPAFLSAAYEAPDEALRARYSLSGWLDDVLQERLGPLIQPS